MKVIPKSATPSRIASLLAGTLVVAGLLGVPSAASGAGHRVLAINCFRAEYRPVKIVLSCADNGISLKKLVWTRWTTRTAVATGDYVENTCTPTCAQGRFVSKPVELTLAAPGSCPGLTHLVFGLALLKFRHGRPPHAFDHFQFECP